MLQAEHFDAVRKRNRKVARTSRLRILPGVFLNMAWAVRLPHKPHLVEEGEKPGEHMTGRHSNLFVTLPSAFRLLAMTSPYWRINGTD
jgi:hypothetical protein